MFFHTHAYHATKVNEKMDSLIIIGAIIPDFAITSMIGWENLHKKQSIIDFCSYIENNHPQYASLLIGIGNHNALDYLTHIKYRDKPGYAFDNINAELITLVSQAFSINKKTAYGKAHNLIESAVELYILNENPFLKQLVQESISQTDKQKLAKIFSNFYKKSEQKMEISLEKYFSLITKYNLRTIDEWILLWEDLNQLFFKKQINKQLTKNAFELALNITKNTHQEFLNFAVSRKQTTIEDSN